MQWFKHSTASHDDPDISDAEDLFNEFGYTGFFKILEIYGQEFNNLEDGHLNISCTFLSRKLRKSWRIVEQLLNFFSERKRFSYSVNYGRVKLKIPKFIILADNWSKRNKEKLNSSSVVTTAIEEKKNRRRIEKTNTEGFAVWYKSYPKKKSRGEAEKAWSTIKPDNELLKKMVTTLEWQKTSTQWTKENGKYIPHPATWLRAKKWLDEKSISTPKIERISDYT